MDEEGRPRDRAGRRPKRFLTPMQKYEIYLQVIRGEVTMAEAAAAAQVDRSTVVRIRQVAKDGALSALAESRPGIKPSTRDVELDAAKAEIARLSETVKEMAVKLIWEAFLSRGQAEVPPFGLPRRGIVLMGRREDSG